MRLAVLFVLAHRCSARQDVWKAHVRRLEQELAADQIEASHEEDVGRVVTFDQEERCIESSHKVGERQAGKASRPNNSPAAPAWLVASVGPPTFVALVFAIATTVGAPRDAIPDLAQADRAVASTERARWVFNVGMYLIHVSYTLVIPDSLGVTMALGGGPAMSGAIVGIFKAAQVLGFASLWVLFSLVASAWQRYARSILLAASWICLVGSACMAGVAFSAASGDQRGCQITLLLLARAVQGVGAGCMIIVFKTYIARTSPPDWNSLHFSRLNLSGMLGIGSGPLLSSIVHWLYGRLGGMAAFPRGDLREEALSDFTLICFTHFCLSLFGLILMWWYLPQAAVVNSSGDASMQITRVSRWTREDVTQANLSTTHVKLLIFASVIFNGCRGFLVSGLEAGSVMILNGEFGMSKIDSGFVVSVSFVGGVFLVQWLLQRRGRGALWDDRQIRVCLLVALAATPLLGSRPCQLLGGPAAGRAGCVGMLVLANSVLFPVVVLAGSVAEGVMMDHALDEGLFTTNNILLMELVAIDGFGRSLGPVLARGNIHSYGRSIYALQQFATVLASLVMMELLVGRVLRALARARIPRGGLCDQNCTVDEL